MESSFFNTFHYTQFPTLLEHDLGAGRKCNEFHIRKNNDRVPSFVRVLGQALAREIPPKPGKQLSHATIIAAAPPTVDVPSD